MALRRLKQKKLSFSLALVLLVLISTGVILYFFRGAGAWTGNNGLITWGDTTLGRLRISDYTFGSPGTFGGSFRPSAAPVSSAIQFMVNKSAPTRNEKLIGYQLNDGRLYVARCAGACSATTNITANSWSWGTPTILGSNVTTRAFDIAYEQLSGRAMVVYPGNTTGKLYYCIWDGTSWGPVSSCQPTNGSNDITLTDGANTLSGTPAWVKLVSYGGQFGDQRTNDILMAVQDTNNDEMVMHWNGSSWVSADRQFLTSSGGATVAEQQGGNVNAQSFDIGWETDSGTGMVVYADGTALKYRTLSYGVNTWSAATTITTPATAVQWVQMASDPQSNRLSLITAFGSTTTVGSTATATPYIWKTTGANTTWTAGATLTMVQDAGQNISTVWEKAHAGTPQAIFSSSGNGGSTCSTGSATTIPCTDTWTQSGSFTGWATLATASNDIIVGNQMVASPNSDIITMMQNDKDGQLKARTYSGSAWGSLISTNLTTSLINEETTKANNRTYIQKAYEFTYKPYSPWSLNWRVYDSADSSPQAAQDTEPPVPTSGVVHLRVNVVELGGQGETSDTNGVRKKLQFSSGAGCPDSHSCTWTDVAAPSSTSQPWRYSTSGGTSDDTSISNLDERLTGTDTPGLYLNNGTASVAGAVQAASTTEEYDFTIQNYSATIGTDYYFRVYNFGASTSGGTMVNLGPIYREQIANTAGTQNTDCNDGTSNVNCSYPTLLGYSNSPNPPIWDAVPNGTTTPALQLSAADILGNSMEYTIEWCASNSWPCPTGGGTFDQYGTAGSGEPGWSGQDQTCGNGLCYFGSTNVNNSTVATYTVPAGLFAPNTTYYLRARAIDPDGTNSYGLYSSTTSLSTGALSIQINGGTDATHPTCIGNTTVGGVITPCCPPASSPKCSGTSIGNVQIGN